MRITDLLKKEGIELNGPSGTKAETISNMVKLMTATGNINDPEGYEAALTKREQEGTTGIGEGIAIPHGKTAAVDHAGLACMVCKDGTEFDSMDGQPANLIFAIAVPNNADNTHLEMLSRLSMMLMDEDFRKEWISHSQYGFCICMNAGFKRVARMIAAHHARADWGAIIDLNEKDIEPILYLVHHIDDLSAKFGKINVAMLGG